MRISPIFGALALCLVAGTLAGQAQVKPAVKPTVQNVDPCCSITSIDGDTGIVTARVTGIRRALAFKVADKALLASLRIGQTISADFRTRRVAVNGLTPCCEILTLEPDGAEPCCAITSINATSGLVTARVAATSREFTFKVANAALLPAMRIGQAISADFPASRVSVYPGDPCCAITSAVPADVPSAAAKPAGLGSHPYEVSGVEVALLSVQRTSGNTLTVRWEYRNTTGQPRKIGESFGGMGWSEVFSLVYDAYLLDDRTKYPVQKDQAGNLISARQGGKVVTIAAKETHATWARFAAPPAATTKISIFIPGTEPFEDIPIGTGGGGQK